MTVFARVMPLVVNACPGIIARKVVIYQEPALVDTIVLEHGIQTRQIPVVLGITARKEHGKPNLMMVSQAIYVQSEGTAPEEHKYQTNVSVVLFQMVLVTPGKTTVRTVLLVHIVKYRG